MKCKFLELRSTTDHHRDALAAVARAADLPEVRRGVEGSGAGREEEHADLGPQGQPHLLPHSQGKAERRKKKPNFCSQKQGGGGRPLIHKL